MRNFKEIVAYLKEFITTGKSVMIYGDYDVDGVTSTAMLYLLFRSKGVSVSYEVPNRYGEGYGLHESFVDSLKTDLLICVDNGTNNEELLQKVLNKGIDVIVIDHHNVQEQTSLKYFLNPKHPQDTSVFKDKCTASLVRSVCSYVDCMVHPYYFLTLAAIATVCDSMPLVADNRNLLVNAFSHLSKVDNYPIALLDLESSIGHRIGPILNAAGRIGNARDVVEFLTCIDDKQKASQLALKLINYNTVRKERTSATFDNLVVKDSSIIFIHDNTIDIGIIGIIAGRLLDTYKRPAVVISNGIGSARSNEDVDIFSILSVYENLYVTFGGHAQACGFHIDERDVPTLETALNSVKCNTSSETVPYDLEITLDDVTIENYEDVVKLEPFGKGNEEPVFLIKNLNILYKKLVGQNANVLQVYFENNIQGVKFKTDTLPVSNRVNIKCHLRKNEWQGRVSPRLVILELTEL
jgi:single-stranded-DNA-specific exonuclease